MKKLIKLFLVTIHSLCHKETLKILILKTLEIKAFQYDIVCNGVKLSSGAIRNHIPDLMYKLFSIAGYNQNEVDQKFAE